MTPEILTIVALLGGASVFALIASSDSDDSDGERNDGSEDGEASDLPQLSLTSGDDTYVKTESDPAVGDTELFALSGDDQLVLDDANDIVHMDDGVSFVAAGDGDDIIYGGSGNGLFVPGAGNDILYGGSSSDTVIELNLDIERVGSEFVNTNTGENLALFVDDPRDIFTYELEDVDRGADDDMYYGGAGDDTFISEFGSDMLYGGAGDDRLVTNSDKIGSGVDSIYGGSGDDRISVFDGDYIETGSGSDEIFVGYFNSTDLGFAYRPVVIGDFDPDQDLLEIDFGYSFRSLHPNGAEDQFVMEAAERDGDVFIDFIPLIEVSDGSAPQEGGSIVVEDRDNSFAVAQLLNISLAQANAAIEDGAIGPEST